MNMPENPSRRLIRAEVPQERTWDLTDLFPSEQDWENELLAVQEDLKDITAFKNKLTSNATTLLNALKAIDTFENRLIKIATYASLKLNADRKSTRLNSSHVAISYAV